MKSQQGVDAPTTQLTFLPTEPAGLTFHDLYKMDTLSSVASVTMLYKLLEQRTADVNISHMRMPTYEQHLRFIGREPYREWWIIWGGGIEAIGSLYLTRENEIGIGLLKEYQGMGYGTAALNWMLRKHRGERLLANINPNNARSIALFEKFGFELIQHTYARAS
jgi:RimJ/RimL family protein N-acetyltransferase